MDDPKPISSPTVIGYESAGAAPTPAGRRPWWVYGIVGIYLLFFVCLLLTPVLLVGSDRQLLGGCGLIVAILATCGVGLMAVPVRAVRRRPITRRSVLAPILASGLLLGGLAYGGGLALIELFAPAQRVAQTTVARPQTAPPTYQTSHVIDPQAWWIILYGAIAVWVAWSALFLLIVQKRDPAGVGMNLHRMLIAGSVLELLIAVPSHLIVRRRDECCAGMLTGMGICIGVVVALVSFGPSVFLLYHRRIRRISHS